MSKKKTPLIIVACGSGIASSTTAAERLKGVVERENLGWSVQAASFRELHVVAKQADVLATIAPSGKIDYGIPVVNGVSLLTGVGVEKTVEAIKEALNIMDKE